MFELLEGLEEDVLGDVFGVFAVLGDVERRAVDLPIVLPNEHFKGGSIAGLGAFNKGNVRVRLGNRGNRDPRLRLGFSNRRGVGRHSRF